MKQALTDIHGIGADTAELLEAAGFVSARDVAMALPGELHAELEKANDLLKILGKPPGGKEVANWVEAARKLTGEQGPAARHESGEKAKTTRLDSKFGSEPKSEPEPASESPGRDVPDGGAPESGKSGKNGDERLVNFEADPVVVEMLANAPFAIPVPAATMAEQKVPVGEVLPGVILTRARGDIEIRVDTRTRQSEEPPAERRRMPIDEDLVDRGIDVSRIKSIDDVREHRERKRKELRKASPGIDELRTTSEKVNRGIAPNSRRFVRGLLHPHPIRLRIAAIITLTCQLLVVPAIAASILLLFSTLDPKLFPWIGPWLLVFPLSLPVFGLLYLMVAVGMKCRVCTQRIFVPRHCLRHPKAHHITPFGYIFALALHLLVFSWFRCEYCGTGARLKK